MEELPPKMSDFDSAEEAEAYDKWFRAKVEASLADPRPSIPHDEVMARIKMVIAKARQASKRG